MDKEVFLEGTNVRRHITGPASEVNKLVAFYVKMGEKIVHEVDNEV